MATIVKYFHTQAFVSLRSVWKEICFPSPKRLAYGSGQLPLLLLRENVRLVFSTTIHTVVYTVLVLQYILPTPDTTCTSQDTFDLPSIKEAGWLSSRFRDITGPTEGPKFMAHNMLCSYKKKPGRGEARTLRPQFRRPCIILHSTWFSIASYTSHGITNQLIFAFSVSILEEMSFFTLGYCLFKVFGNFWRKLNFNL